MKTTNETKILAFYGSLRQGMYNFEAFSKSYDMKVLRRNLRIGGYTMYDLGYYPCITEGGQSIVVDLVEVTQECFEHIDQMERGAGYTPKPISIGDYGECYIYVYRRKPNTRLVHDGDWVKHFNSKKVH